MFALSLPGSSDLKLNGTFDNFSLTIAINLVKLHSLEPFVALIFSNLTWAVLYNRQCFYCENIVCE